MSKKIIVTIVIAAILTVGFVLVAVGAIGPSKSANTDVDLPDAATVNTVPKTASLYFSSPLLKVNTAQATPTQVDILVNTGNAQISGTQVELTYDPTILTNVRISPPQDSFFGSQNQYSVLFSSVDTENGKISFAIAARARGFEKQGNGKVATISFTASPTAQAQNTNVQFAPTTLVTIFGASQTVLKEAAGLTVVLENTLTRAQ